EDDGAFARLAIAAVLLLLPVAHATDPARPSADRLLHRIGHHGLAQAGGIVEIGPHERQRFRAEVAREGLDVVAVLDEGGVSAVLAVQARGERQWQQQNRQIPRWYPEVPQLPLVSHRSPRPALF